MEYLLGFLIAVGLIATWMLGHYDQENDTSWGLVSIAATAGLMALSLLL